MVVGAPYGVNRPDRQLEETVSRGGDSSVVQNQDCPVFPYMPIAYERGFMAVVPFFGARFKPFLRGRACLEQRSGELASCLPALACESALWWWMQARCGYVYEVGSKEFAGFV